MSGDRALDERVYVEVFGNVLGHRFHTAEDWEIARGMTRREDFHRCRRCRTQRKKLSKAHWDDNTLCVPSVPKYSSDMNAAMTVLEWLIHRLTEQDIHIETHGGNGWKVGSCYSSREGGLGDWGEWFEAPTLPEAICRAALAATRGAAAGDGEVDE